MGITGIVCQASGASVGVIVGVNVIVWESAAAAFIGLRVASLTLVSAGMTAVVPYSEVDAGGDPAQAVTTSKNTNPAGIVGIFTRRIISVEDPKPLSPQSPPSVVGPENAKDAKILKLFTTFALFASLR
jgi:hypothetical protein